MASLINFLTFLVCGNLFLPIFLTEGQIIRPGSCEEQAVSAKQNFNLTKYLGRWYEQERYPAPFEDDLSCVTAEYSSRPDGRIKVNNKGIQSDGQAAVIIGNAYPPNPLSPAKLLVSFPYVPDGSLWIVETDYTSFSVAYSCTNVNQGSSHQLGAWLLSRARGGFSGAIHDRIMKVLQQNHIDVGLFQHVDQTTCSSSHRN